jgi:hypothetical protein
VFSYVAHWCSHLLTREIKKMTGARDAKCLGNLEIYYIVSFWCCRHLMFFFNVVIARGDCALSGER